jgi:uncharacterized protein (TIGR03000 family)
MRVSSSRSLPFLLLALAVVVVLPNRGSAQNYDVFEIMRFSDRTVYIVPKGFVPNAFAAMAAPAYALPTATVIDPRLWTTSAVPLQAAPIPSTAYGTDSYYGAANSALASETAITLRLPPSAQVWIDGKETNQSGPERRFVLSLPDSSKSHDYEVRAHWTENGREVSTTNRLEMRSGDQKSITFVAALAGQKNNSSREEIAKPAKP